MAETARLLSSGLNSSSLNPALNKAPGAFRTISEVAAELEVPPHVLRFWESKFTQIKPLKRGGGRRYYRPEDVAMIRQVRTLLYRDGYTIKGAQKLLKTPGNASGDQPAFQADTLSLPRRLVKKTVLIAPVATIGSLSSNIDAKEFALSSTIKAELKTLLDELVALRELIAPFIGN